MNQLVREKSTVFQKLHLRQEQNSSGSQTCWRKCTKRINFCVFLFKPFGIDGLYRTVLVKVCELFQLFEINSSRMWASSRWPWKIGMCLGLESWFNCVWSREGGRYPGQGQIRNQADIEQVYRPPTVWDLGLGWLETLDGWMNGWIEMRGGGGTTPVLMREQELDSNPASWRSCLENAVSTIRPIICFYGRNNL